MSKFNELDQIKYTATREFALGLALWLQAKARVSLNGMPATALTNMIEEYMAGEEEDAAPQDWIGEALSRREECKLDRLINENIRLRAGLVEDQPDPVRETLTPEAEYTCDPAPCNAHLQRPSTGFDDTPPPNGYVCIPDNRDCTTVYGSLNELIADQTNHDFDPKDFSNNNDVFELGNKLKPVQSVTWEVCDE